MQNVAMDFGKGVKLQFCDWEGNALPQQKSVLEFLERYSPVRIFTETAMACKEPEERNSIIDYAQARGSVILTVGTRTTMTYRKLWGMPKDERSGAGDLADAQLIRRIALETDALFLPIKKAEVREPNIQRRANRLTARRIAEVLGPPDDNLSAFCDVKTGKYAKTTALFVQTALEQNTRKAFLRNVGAHGHGYPNYLRATFYRRVKTLVRQRLGVRGLSKVPLEQIDPIFREEQKRLFRALKVLFARVKQQQGTRTNLIPKRTKVIPAPAAA